MRIKDPNKYSNLALVWLEEDELMIYYLKNKNRIILEFEAESKEKKAFDNTFYEQEIVKVKILGEILPNAIDKQDLTNLLKMWIENSGKLIQVIKVVALWII